MNAGAGGIVVHHLGHGADEADDLLGHVVAGGGLAAEQHAARDQPRAVAALDAVVEMDDVQGVEELALVFVDALHLHVEEGVGVEAHAAVAQDDVR